MYFRNKGRKYSFEKKQNYLLDNIEKNRIL